MECKLLILNIEYKYEKAVMILGKSSTVYGNEQPLKLNDELLEIILHFPMVCPACPSHDAFSVFFSWVLKFSPRVLVLASAIHPEGAQRLSHCLPERERERERFQVKVKELHRRERRSIPGEEKGT